VPDSAALDLVLERSARFAGGPFAWVMLVSLEPKVTWAPQPEIPWRKVLLRQHSNDPQLWGLPGGPICTGETAEQAACRWLQEQVPAFGDRDLSPIGDGVFLASAPPMSTEVLRAIPPKSFWAPEDLALSSEVLHPTARATLERTDDVMFFRPTTQERTMDKSAFTAAQSRADRVLRAFGDEAPPAVAGETLLEYRKRLLRPLQKFSPKLKAADLSKISDVNAFEYFEDGILADAAAEAAQPTAASLRPGELREIRTPDQSGRVITRYIAADPGACWDRFHGPIRYLQRFLVPGTAR
jgi:hypothetical protein